MNREIIIVMDASGSMGHIQRATEDGVRELLAEQAQTEGVETVVTLWEFTTERSWTQPMGPMVLRQIYDREDITKVSYRLTPQCGTPLIDAVVTVVNNTRDRYKKTPVSERPDQVTLLIVTDGLENASTEYDEAAVKALLEKVQRPLKDDSDVRSQVHKRGWKVMYLGANQDAEAVGMSIGVAKGSSLSYGTGGEEVASTYVAASASMMRSVRGEDDSFTEQERKEALGG